MRARAKSPPSRRPAAFSGLIGVARADITPPVGIYARSWGAAKHDVAEGIHRQLTLTCLTFRSGKGGKPLVLIAADLGWWRSLEDERFVREPILKAFSLHPSQLMFCLSHTHAAPSTCRDDRSKPGGHLIEPYLLKLQRVAIGAIRRALAKAVPATLTWRYGACDLATNRDLPEPRKKRFVVGFNPMPKADQTLLVGRVTFREGCNLATIVNYACHPTTLAWDNRLISPDYVGAMREVVEARTQGPCLFLQGASGELAPSEQYTGDCSVAEAHGQRLGHCVLATLQGMLPPEKQLSFFGVVESGAALGIWKRTTFKARRSLSARVVKVDLPLKPSLPLATIEEKWRACKNRAFKERLWRQLNRQKAVGDGKSAQTPLWLWCLGDALLVGHANEAYSQFQQQLRAELFPSPVVTINIVNGYVAYLPPRRLYGKNIYPVWQTPFAAGALELLTKTACERGRRMMVSR
jgi:hypothetical protein